MMTPDELRLAVMKAIAKSCPGLSVTTLMADAAIAVLQDEIEAAYQRGRDDCEESWLYALKDKHAF